MYSSYKSYYPTRFQGSFYLTNLLIKTEIKVTLQVAVGRDDAQTNRSGITFVHNDTELIKFRISRIQLRSANHVHDCNT